MMTPLLLALVALFTPLAAALVIAVVVPLRRRGTPAAVLSVAAVLVTLGAALKLFADQLAAPHQVLLRTVPWLPQGAGSLVDVGVRLDGISIPMLVVLASVAA